MATETPVRIEELLWTEKGQPPGMCFLRLKANIPAPLGLQIIELVNEVNARLAAGATDG